MNFGALGSVISGVAALLFLILTLATFRSRRTGREAHELRQVKEVNIAVMEWAYKVRALAAINGWPLPAIPREMSPEYLMGKAEGDNNVELEQMAKMVATLTGGKLPGGDRDGRD